MPNAAFHVQADEENNRLYLCYCGFFSPEQARSAADQTIAEARKLKPGFDIINDISRASPFVEKSAQEVERAQAFMKQQGVGRIVRIVNPERLASKVQFDLQGREAGYEKQSEVAHSLEEAERLLDQSA